VPFRGSVGRSNAAGLRPAHAPEGDAL
jgi:hypothetical protein